MKYSPSCGSLNNLHGCRAARACSRSSFPWRSLGCCELVQCWLWCVSVGHITDLKCFWRCHKSAKNASCGFASEEWLQGRFVLAPLLSWWECWQLPARGCPGAEIPELPSLLGARSALSSRGSCWVSLPKQATKAPGGSQCKP